MSTNSVREVTINGLSRLVYGSTTESFQAEEAIPADIYPILEEVFEGCSTTFLNNLWAFLWARGIITMADFAKPQAMQLLTQAIKLAIKEDSLSVAKRIKEIQNGS